jgi:pimeloyl-ACP methyl ester carboxylesterase
MDFVRDGVRLHYELHGPDDGRPIVLVHGFASHYRLNWVGTRWQEALAGAGFRVMGLDCRGHGASDKPHETSAYAGELMAADVVALLDEVGVARADYLGFSMGARIGLQCVLDSPARWRSAVLAGVGLRGAIDDAASIARAFRGGSVDTPVARSFLQFATGHRGDLAALAACIEAPQPALEPARLGAIKTPMLLVIGSRDELVSGAEELVEEIPTARLVTVPGRDHLGTVPAREFKEAALAFLESE